MKTQCHESFLKSIPSEHHSKRKVVLVGNPNVGKSLFFGYLSKQYAHVSNYPGTTVDLLHAIWQNNLLIDTPGIYSVSSLNDEERVARDIILEADIVVNIVDAVRLERDLFLTQQLIDMGKSVMVTLNFMDEAKNNGLQIDVAKLSAELGVPVVPTIAKNGVGLKETEDMILKARVGHRNSNIVSKLSLKPENLSAPQFVLLLEGDKEIAASHTYSIENDRENIYKVRRARVNEIVSNVVEEASGKPLLSERIGKWALDPIYGSVLFVFVLLALYQFVGVWIAQDLVNITEKQLLHQNWNPMVEDLLAQVLSRDNPLYILLAGEFGILTMAITYVIGLLLPLVIGFYLILGVLEDSGYLPRLATFMDRLFNKIGLNGRAVIPLILGLGCVQLGIISTRLLTSDREKRIVASILNFTIPCSAQLAVITAMLAGANISGWHVLLYMAVMFAIFVLVGTLLNKVLPGRSLPLLIDLPPMRLPKLKNLVLKTANRSYFFLKEATPWFFLGAFLVALLQISGGLTLWQKFWAPVTESWLKLPSESATAFIMGMVRRDFGAAGLMKLNLDPMQTVVSLIVITLFVPCIASFMILLKERGAKEGITIWIGSMILAFLVGGIVAQVFI